ncbi:MAG: FKBP-type peptidyl-prolyl cis-trans isomerase [Actinomycetota bacterium]
MSRERTVCAALLPLVFLAACSSKTEAAALSGLDSITVGGTHQVPEVTFNAKPLSVKVTTTKVVTPGSGAKLSKANKVEVAYAVFNAKDGKQISSSFGRDKVLLDLSSAKMMPGLSKGLIGQQVGSRFLIAIPPVDGYGAKGYPKAGVGPTDTIVFFVDLRSASTPLAAAGGIAVPPKAGLPTVIVDGAKPATIEIPKAAAPTKLIVQPLIKGAGAVVTSGQIITVNYTGVLWKDGKRFDASGDNLGPTDIQIGVGKAFPGWDKGLVGQTVGSRILLVVPPADGYGAKGKPPTIGPTDTMVFVVEILGPS